MPSWHCVVYRGLVSQPLLGGAKLQKLLGLLLGAAVLVLGQEILLSFLASDLKETEGLSDQLGWVISRTLRKKFLLFFPYSHHMSKSSLWRHPKYSR